MYEELAVPAALMMPFELPFYNNFTMMPDTTYLFYHLRHRNRWFIKDLHFFQAFNLEIWEDMLCFTSEVFWSMLVIEMKK